MTLFYLLQLVDSSTFMPRIYSQTTTIIRCWKEEKWVYIQIYIVRSGYVLKIFDFLLPLKMCATCRMPHKHLKKRREKRCKKVCKTLFEMGNEKKELLHGEV